MTNKSSHLKAAAVACVLLVPIFIGTGIIADGATRAALVMITGTDPGSVLTENLWPMFWVWLVSCVIVLFMAALTDRSEQ